MKEIVEHTLSLLAMEKFLKQAGAPRVSVEAAEALRKALEKSAASYAGDAVRLMRHAGRRTVKASDVELASER